MKTYLRLMSDRQMTVVTVPSLDFNSLHDRSLRQLTRLFQHAAERVVGTTVILDVTPVKTAGAGFLTAVHHLATALAGKQVRLVIAGDLKGLFRLAGWERRFRLYPSLVAALLAWAEWGLPANSDGSSRCPEPTNEADCDYWAVQRPDCGCRTCGSARRR
jgi:hypothetical protein